MKKIILIHGMAQVGKDTMANYIKKKLESQGEKVIIDRFAKYIKMYLRDYYGWDGITKDEDIRTKLQILGTETIKEKLNFKCFHAKRLSEDFQIFQDEFDYFIVPDVRFRDEVYIMKAMFPDLVTTISITGKENFTGGLNEEQLQHKSENDLNGFSFDWFVKNGSDLNEYYNTIDKLLNVMDDED